MTNPSVTPRDIHPTLVGGASTRPAPRTGSAAPDGTATLKTEDQVALADRKTSQEARLPGLRDLVEKVGPAPRAEQNPLLDFSGPPRFDLVQPAHVRPAVDTLVAETRATVERLTDPSVPPTWNDFAAPLNDCLERFDRAFNVVSHLNATNGIPEWRQAYNETLPDVTTVYTELGQNQALFDKFKALRQSPEYDTLTQTQQKIVDNQVRDFRLSGAELAPEQKARYAEIQQELSTLTSRFSQNVLDSTNAFSLVVTNEAELAGLPADAKKAARNAAQADGVEGWKFTLQAPSYGAVMQYAENRELRERMYRANGTVASEFGKPEWDNGPVMQRILELRQEMAQMLGFPSYADLSLTTKMADSPEQVLGFLKDLAARARPFGENDMAQVREFARDQLGMQKVEPWDMGFASEKLRQAKYDFSQQEVKQYYSEAKVLSGLFDVLSNLYGVDVKPDDLPTWNPDVKAFRLEKDGKLVGQFYMDLYARSTKRGGAWMDQARARKKVGDEVQTPIVYINCNFTPPTKGQAPTFTPDEVRTLFHETGHAMHGLMTEVDEAPLAGTSGVEWDSVELPSQFMENFTYDRQVVKDMTGHVETGEPLPDALFDKMTAARNFQSGMATLRQVEFATFDMRLHSDFDPKGEKTIMQLLDEVRQETAVSIPPPWHRFPNAFKHIFSGAYGAGYYSYKWSQVLSSDAFAAFEEAGNCFDPATAERFRKEILSVGGSRPAMESFVAFRGREPKIDALLRHSGLVGDPNGSTEQA